MIVRPIAPMAALLCMAFPAVTAAQQLPDGPGKGAVQGTCTACHQLNLVERSSGYTREGWRELILTMMDLRGSPQLDEMTAYLATHYPPNGRNAAKLVPGDVRIAFQEWVAPTLGQRTRDPAEAPDGSIWYAGQWADLVGRIDPATGAIKEFPLPDGAKAHTVLADPQGNIWYAGNGNATVGKLDPATGAVTVFKMPDPAARDPHSMVMDASGTLFFTLQQSNMIGRLVPATGEIRLAAVATPRARPYGIKLDSKGVPWVAANGSNRVIRVDPETLELREYELPQAKTTVRRLAFDRDDTIWYVNSSLGYLGRLDPATGAVKEWPTPSGPRAHPYAIAVVSGIVWYNESGVRPDALVRFDPATESFQSWAIPSGGVHAGIVRHMRVARDGSLLIHQSSTNRVLRVTVERAAAGR